jgi:branched-chain amino acid aminotransferase
MALEIKVVLCNEKKKKTKNYKESELGFGQYFSDHYFIMDYEDKKGWYDPRIIPYQPLALDPAAMALHYGQEIFEGLKAYRGKDGGVYLFRVRDNIRRMNRSAQRLCMPVVDEEIFFQAIKKLVLVEKEWIPNSRGTALYIRPTMIATEPALGVRASKKYVLFVIVGPVGAYYPEGLNPIKIFVTDRFVRAVKGGMGDAKAAGNYAASLLAGEEARKLGYSQVLWLDAIKRKYVEEVGAMNIFFYFDNTLVTPILSGSILPGITRDSVIKITESWGIKVEERKLGIDEVIGGISKGTVKEVFGSGTAAVISPVGELNYLGNKHIINAGKIGELSNRLYSEITSYQYGEKPAPHGWVERIDK